MKKIILALLSIIGLMGCNSGKYVYDNISIAHVTEAGGIDDNSFNASAWLGITTFFEEHNFNSGYQYLIANDQTTMEATIALATDLNKDLVSVAGFNFASPISNIAKQYPDQKYLLVDGSNVSEPNVKTVLFAEEQAGFLVGYLTVLKANEMGVEDPVFGFIGGIPGSVVTRFEMGYIQGIKHFNPNAILISAYVDSWIDPSKAKMIVQEWLQSYPSLFAVFGCADTSGSGAIAQIKEARSVGRNVWSIGVDSDQYFSGFINHLDNVVLTSALKNVNIALYATLNEVYEGNFKSGEYRFDLNNNGVGYSRSHPIVNTSKIDVIMDDLINDIKNNTITIYSTRAETELAGFIFHDTNAQD